MQTRRASPGAASGKIAPRQPAQTAVIVNGSAETMNMIEPLLEAGHYQIVFVESPARAYSQTKRIRPDLVVMFVGLEDRMGFQVLSMLRLDEETRPIPVLTYIAANDHGNDREGEPREEIDVPIAARPPAFVMN